MHQFKITAILAIGAVLLVSLPLVAQESRPATSQPALANPAADGFDHEGSDARAIAIADATMEAMGGRAAWDATRYITWKFFDFRMHVWDKHTGDLRVEYSRDDKNFVLLTNLHTGEGKAFIDGKPVTDAEELSGMMKNAKSAWINDAYWIVMPYKLKDSGVTLTYVGEQDMEDGREADVLQLVFEGVGNTPENKYHVWVAKDSGLVEQWAFFSTADAEEPRLVTPWHNWQKHGDIMLSDDRGEMRGNPTRHTGVAVYDELPRSVFESPEPVELPNMGAMRDRADQNPLEKLVSLVGTWDGDITVHDPDGEDRIIPIQWESDWAFNQRYLRFEFTTTETSDGGHLEWAGYFTASADGRAIETVWVNPAIRSKTDRFLDNNLIFMERGTFDSSGTVLTLDSQQQAAADAPEETIRSVFTLVDADHFTVVDMDRNPGSDQWTPKFTFALTRR